MVKLKGDVLGSDWVRGMLVCIVWQRKPKKLVFKSGHEWKKEQAM